MDNVLLHCDAQETSKHPTTEIELFFHIPWPYIMLLFTWIQHLLLLYTFITWTSLTIENILDVKSEFHDADISW